MTFLIDQAAHHGVAPRCLVIERPAQPEQARDMRHAVQRYLAEMDWPDEAAYEVALAVGEAVNNAVSYGEGRGDATVSLCCRLIRPGQLQIEVRNHGTFAPDIDALSLLPDGLAVHGRGFALMSTLMDTVQVFSEGQETVVRLAKRLPA
jgi:anti-sigma regulatory factor (Ser/Thr protein kinase)